MKLKLIRYALLFKLASCEPFFPYLGRSKRHGGKTPPVPAIRKPPQHLRVSYFYPTANNFINPVKTHAEIPPGYPTYFPRINLYDIPLANIAQMFE